MSTTDLDPCFDVFRIRIPCHGVRELFRQATLSDFASVMELYAQLQPHDPILEDGSDHQVYEQILVADNLHLFVLEGADSPVDATCYLNIVRRALQFAWDQGCYKEMLQTGSKRNSTHNFYKSCGFSGDDKFAFVARP